MRGMMEGPLNMHMEDGKMKRLLAVLMAAILLTGAVSFAGAEEERKRLTNSEGFVYEIKEDGTKLEAFYNYAYRDVNDKYSAFLGSDNKSNGGNNAVTLITKTTNEPRRKMIVLKDSFGHSLVPFLAIDYDLIVLDMRYYNGDMSEYLSEPDLSAILVIYNMETFSNNDGPQKAGGCVIGYFNQ